MALETNWPREVNRLQSEMDRLFGRGNGLLPQSHRFPAINLLEDDDNLYVESENPGMELDEFELFVNDENQLTLQGDRKQPNGGAKTRHREERAFGRFSRSVSRSTPKRLARKFTMVSSSSICPRPKPQCRNASP
jgi:HSP20 family protein